jgi:hypothetical protein
MLCGIDLNFDALKEKIAELKKSAMDQVNETVADAKVVVKAAFTEFETILRSMIPEMPEGEDLPGIPMLTELLVLTERARQIMANPTAEGLKLLAQLKSDFLKKYGDALAKSGSNLDDLIGGLLDGIDPCSLVPNIVTDSAGNIIEKVKKPLYAKTDALSETLSVELPAMKTLREQISSALGETEVNLELSKTLATDSLGKFDLSEEIKKMSEMISPELFHESAEKMNSVDDDITKSLEGLRPSQLLAKLEEVRKNV